MVSSGLVSIIIPSYNSATWVSDAIDCSLNQTYPNCEVIVVDDGSADNTSLLLQEKYGYKINYVYQSNHGLASARNTGIRNAKGEYLQFLDADDLIHPEKIEQQVKILNAVHGPALSYCDYVHCDLNEPSLYYHHCYRSPQFESGFPLYELASRWETELSIPVHCFLFNSLIFKEHDITFDERLPNHEDWDCWMKVFALNPIVKYLDKVMAFYRIRGQSMCKNKRLMRQGFLQAIRNQKQLFINDTKMLGILKEKKRQVCSYYCDVGPIEEILECLPKNCRDKVRGFIPWRIKRLF